MNRQNLSHEMIELAYYSEHDQDFGPDYYDPVYKTLGKFHKAGKFSLDQAIKYIDRYLLLPAAKSYIMEHGSLTDSVKNIFPKTERMKLAEVLALEMVGEFRLGNY